MPEYPAKRCLRRPPLTVCLSCRSLWRPNTRLSASHLGLKDESLGLFRPIFTPFPRPRGMVNIATQRAAILVAETLSTSARLGRLLTFVPHLPFLQHFVSIEMGTSQSIRRMYHTTSLQKCQDGVCLAAIQRSPEPKWIKGGHHKGKQYLVRIDWVLGRGCMHMFEPTAIGMIKHSFLFLLISPSSGSCTLTRLYVFAIAPSVF